jgi:hypothetical protein
MSCRLPPPTSVTGRVIRCGSEAVKQNWPRVLPAVNTCLAEALAPAGCLLALVDPAIGVTEDVIACLVRDRGEAFRAAATANPADDRSRGAAAAGRLFLADRGYVFE